MIDSAPPTGICAPCVLHRVRDADTVEVRLPGSSLIWAIRLIGVWAPELTAKDEPLRRIAREGADWLTERLEAAPSLKVFIPFPATANLLRELSFDRLLGVLFVGEEPVNRMIIERGYASSTKDGRLGE